MPLCLSMIVKNESKVIARCLRSVRPFIDHWVIVDTGSTDGTQALIRTALEGVPGDLHERPWRDFATNRTEALELARDHGSYLLFIDADDELDADADFRMPALTADSYELPFVDSGILYHRKQLVKTSLAWCWRGVLHEFLTCDTAQSMGQLPGLRMLRRHDGARRLNGETYQRDAEILRAALMVETDPFLQARYTFYLAQSYRDCGQREAAVTYYLARAALGFWAEEVFVSLLNAARLMEALERPVDEILAVYAGATEACPQRVEARHGASRLCAHKGRHREGYEIAGPGLGLTLPRDALFLEPWIYLYGLRDEYAINAYWVGQYRASLESCVLLLAGATLPPAERERVLGNAQFALDKLPRDPELGSLGQEEFVAQHALRPARLLHGRLAPPRPPTVMLAILAKQKARALPLYLACIEALHYPKSCLSLYIRTNNNTDATEAILRDWVARVGHRYASVTFDAADVAEPVEQYGVHEWNPTRFRVLGRIRNASLAHAMARGCAYYFTADVDNFIRPETLRELVALDLPIVAPLLRSIAPEVFYANFHAEVDDGGYYRECDQYHWVLNRHVRGVFEMPVVHCTYLVRGDVLPDLSYEDATERHEYVVFSDRARKCGVPQYLDNRQVYGYITFDADDRQHVADGIARAENLLGADMRRSDRSRVYFPDDAELVG